MIAVFFPSLMGVGILISGALLISDWLRRLLPHGALRRRHNVIVGTYGAIAGAVAAAGHELNEPWFLRRGLRRRWWYFAVSGGLMLLAAGAIWAGVEFYTDSRGLFYRSPWAVGIGYGIGAVFLLLSVFCLVVGIAYRSAPAFLMWLISETPLGMLILPSQEEQAEALNNIDSGGIA